MLELGRDLDLAGEGARRGTARVEELLQRDRPLEPPIVRAEHASEAATRVLAADLVVVRVDHRPLERRRAGRFFLRRPWSEKAATAPNSSTSAYSTVSSMRRWMTSIPPTDDPSAPRAGRASFQQGCAWRALLGPEIDHAPRDQCRQQSFLERSVHARAGYQAACRHHARGEEGSTAAEP